MTEDVPYKTLIARMARMDRHAAWSEDDDHPDRDQDPEYETAFEAAVQHQIMELAEGDEVEKLLNPDMRPSLRDLPWYQELREAAAEAVESDIEYRVRRDVKTQWELTTGHDPAVDRLCPF